MKTRTTTEIGKYGEEQAVKLLRHKGYRILERNYRAGHNEIDVIAQNKNYTVFVEVKTRSEHHVYGFDYGEPADAVTLQKQKRTVQAAKAYLYKYDGNSEHDRMIRFDVIEVYLKNVSFSAFPSILKIEHIEDAFSPR